jgi:hypothetical protein
MSLKAFHILFIVLATLLAAGCAWWAFSNQVGTSVWVTSSILALCFAAYGVYFVKKSKRLIL